MRYSQLLRTLPPSGPSCSQAARVRGRRPPACARIRLHVRPAPPRALRWCSYQWLSKSWPLPPGSLRFLVVLGRAVSRFPVMAFDCGWDDANVSAKLEDEVVDICRCYGAKGG